MTAATRRKAHLQRVARMGGPEAAEAKRMLAKESAADAGKAEADELAALPKTLAEADGDARALMKADMRRRVAGQGGQGSDEPRSRVHGSHPPCQRAGAGRRMTISLAFDNSEEARSIRRSRGGGKAGKASRHQSPTSRNVRSGSASSVQQVEADLFRVIVGSLR